MRLVDTRDCQTSMESMERHQKEFIQGNLKTLLRGDCEVEKVMRFLRDIDMFKEM